MPKAIAISRSGGRREFTPALQQGDSQTRSFANASRSFVLEGGISICISDMATNAALDEAIEFLHDEYEREERILNNDAYTDGQ